MQSTYDKYIAMRDELGRTEKPQTLMDMATIFGRYERANGRLDDMKCLTKSMLAQSKLKWTLMV